MKKEEVLETIEQGRVFTLKPEDFSSRRMTITEMRSIFKHLNAIWQYWGEPQANRPHALLKSGLHSNGFIVCKEVLDHPTLCDIFAHEMLRVIERCLGAAALANIDVVASPAYSAITLGMGVARLLSGRHNLRIKYVIVEKDCEGNPTVIRGGISSDKKILILNELMTTATGSTFEARKAVLDCNRERLGPRVIEPAFVLVHRSTAWVLADGSLVENVFHFDIQNYPPDKCPYCDVGSVALKPKEGENWEKYFKN